MCLWIYRNVKFNVFGDEGGRREKCARKTCELEPLSVCFGEAGCLGVEKRDDFCSDVRKPNVMILIFFIISKIRNSHI